MKSYSFGLRLWLAFENTSVIATGIAMAFIGVSFIFTVDDVHCQFAVPHASKLGNGASSSRIYPSLRNYASAYGVLAIVAALLAIIGGSLGAFGSIQKSKGSVRCTVALLVITISASFICLSIAYVGAIHASFFDNYDCGVNANGLKGAADAPRVDPDMGSMSSDMGSMNSMMFHMMDKNQDGVLNKAEVLDTKENEEQALEMFNEMDKDGDGKITKEEADSMFSMFSMFSMSDPSDAGRRLGAGLGEHGLCYDNDCEVGRDCYACEEEVEAFQAFSAKFQAAIVMSTILMIVAFNTSILDCAAVCCCPQCFGMEDQLQTHGVGAVTYGQPVPGQVVQGPIVVGHVVES